MARIRRLDLSYSHLGKLPDGPEVFGRGVLSGTRVEALYRDIRPLRIYEGTTEIQKLVIARELLHHGV